jgi:hypothetical protein
MVQVELRSRLPQLTASRSNHDRDEGSNSTRTCRILLVERLGVKRFLRNTNELHSAMEESCNKTANTSFISCIVEKHTGLESVEEQLRLFERANAVNRASIEP